MSRDIVDYYNPLKIACFVASIKFNRSAHFHFEMEMIYVRKGTVRISIRNEPFFLREGDIAVLESNVVHSLSNAGIYNELEVIMFSPQILGNIFPEFGNLKFSKYIICQGDKEMYLIVKKSLLSIFNEFRNRTLGYSFRVMGMLNLICAEIMEHMVDYYASAKEVVHDAKILDRLAYVINYVNEHYAEMITLQEIAEREHIDKVYLSHLVKDYLGISFRDYLTQIRTERAEWLIESTDMNIIDIGVESGFSDYKYLCKAFKDKHGCTPSQYRNQHQNIKHYASENQTLEKRKINEIVSEHNEEINGIIEFLN